jgi:hypothetical protein
MREWKYCSTIIDLRISGKGAMLQAGRSLVRDKIRLINFPIYLTLPAALSPEVHSASNRNKYKEAEKLSFWGLG